MPFDDQLNQVMLTHAAIIYRGFARPTGGAASLRRAMAELLGRLSPVKDQWDIVWGPTTSHAHPDPFADAAMYVARRRQLPGRTGSEQFVVVIRGTNPISLFDWVFGDFMVLRQVPWAYGRPADPNGARISFSTALGLHILQQMRSETETGLPTQPPAAALGRTASTLVQALADGSRLALGGARAELVGDLRTMDEIAKNVTGEKFDKWAAALGQRRESKDWADWLKAVDNAVRERAGEGLDLLRLVPGAATAVQGFSGGVTLQQFLRDQTARARGNLDIYVTGHSKGGALCTALAMWLADTQGREPVTPADQWDPERVATVHAYAFAGPTPGNGAFARHVDAILGGRCHRIFNRLDLVPHVFATRDLDMIPGLYDPPQIERRALDALAAPLIRAVKPLDYQHTRSDSIELPGQLVGGLPLVAQAIHQHLDGYFEQMGLSGEMGTLTFFGEL